MNCFVLRCLWSRLIVGLIIPAVGFGVAGAQASVVVEPDLVYGSALDYTGSNVVLTLDAYYEPGTQTNRPVVILAHGGGFGGGDKGYTIWQGNFYPDMATAFATNGFVAFSINYRLKFPWPMELDVAVEDVITALDWIRANSTVYGIDASKVLIAGDSAGGGLAVNGFPADQPLRLGDAGLHVSDGRFIFDIAGPTNMTVGIDTSSDLTETWQAIATNQLLLGRTWFTNEMSATNRFFRARLVSP